MSKPSWDTAPEWAQFLAKDRDGEWWWYEYKPVVEYFKYWIPSTGRSAIAKRDDDWKSTLEQRP